MKIYGNSRSDGFNLFVTLVAALFVGGGFLLAAGGGVTLLASFPVLLALVGAMVVMAKKWDVMSDVVPASAQPQLADEGAPTRLPNFPVKADTEAVAVGAKAGMPGLAMPSLPSPIDKPKSAVETNTAVA